MKTSIDFLPEFKQEELRKIVEYVKNADQTSMPVHMVILFGSHARDTWVQDKYVEDGTIYEYRSDIDILFVTSTEKQARNSSLTSSIYNRVLKNVNVNTYFSPIYHGIDYINARLKERNYFFIDIYEEGVRIYDTELYAIEEPPKVLPKDVRLMEARYYYEKWLNSADDFLQGYELYFARKNYAMSVFHLHQTTEHLYMAINLVYTNYKPKLHDLTRLNTFILDFDKKFGEAFPCRNEKEEKLFKKLNDAYIDSRYKKDYSISIAELDYFVDRIRVLQKLAEELCFKFILALMEEVPSLTDEMREKIRNSSASTPGFYVGREKAEFEEGKEKNLLINDRNIEIAKKMLLKGMDAVTISEMTDLSIEEIEKLK